MMPEIEIIRGGFEREDVMDLLTFHVSDAQANSPLDSSHAMTAHALNTHDIQFWHYRIGGELVGFCALKHTSADTAEIKSMRTDTNYQKRGIGSFILNHIIHEAKARGYGKLELETGANEAFLPARRLYKKHGFNTCSPIKGYSDHPFSVFMRLSL
ncbi:MAG TPA: GNAT family N-acetyltransferase [Hellea balneolensis]|uniref:GNAT family N-acetyltransferase n=1 Tax=Hellea balneolensis TaxID=287478 RepID=A0A7C5LXA2_9PROT|nr:GNAT family N-acetyltransferase [Hellea balneolensis]